MHHISYADSLWFLALLLLQQPIWFPQAPMQISHCNTKQFLIELDSFLTATIKIHQIFHGF
jgi:hypothetical protein